MEQIGRVEEAVKDILGYDEYSAFENFSIKLKEGYEEEEIYEIHFTLIGYPFDIEVRETAEDQFEYNAYEDTWYEFNTYSWKSADLLRYLLFEVCGDKRLRPKD